MDLRKLKKLIDLVEESGIAEIEVTEGEEKVRIWLRTRKNCTALRRNGVGGLGALAWKNLSKLRQFF